MAEKKIEIGVAIKYGWESVKKNLWYFVGLAFVVCALQSIGSYGSDTNMNLWDLVGFLASTWMTVGYLYMILSFYDKKKKPLVEVFGQWKYFGRALLASIWLALIIGLGFVLLVVPGIYLALKYQFVLNLIVDKDLSISQAMKESAEMTKGVKLRLFGFMFAVIGVMLLGVICLGVGVLVAMPVVWLAEIYIYRNLMATK
jgi:uncharacterized membrane protein